MESEPGADDDTLSPADLRGWFAQEVRDLTKAMELRIQDAADFVTAYAAQEITSQQAMARLLTYQARWGDSPTCGVAVEEDASNAIIIEKIDASVVRGRRETLMDRKRLTQYRGRR
jgi:hypothetical protein